MHWQQSATRNLRARGRELHKTESKHFSSCCELPYSDSVLPTAYGQLRSCCRNGINKKTAQKPATLGMRRAQAQRTSWVQLTSRPISISPAAGCTNTKGCIGDSSLQPEYSSLGTQQQEHSFPTHTPAELCTPPTHESIFPFAHGKAQVCHSVPGGPLQRTEKWLTQRSAVSIILSTHTKTNCDFLHRRSNNISVTANYTPHKYIKGSGVEQPFCFDLELAPGFHA